MQENEKQAPKSIYFSSEKHLTSHDQSKKYNRFIDPLILKNGKNDALIFSETKLSKEDVLIDLPITSIEIFIRKVLLKHYFQSIFGLYYGGKKKHYRKNKALYEGLIESYKKEFSRDELEKVKSIDFERVFEEVHFYKAVAIQLFKKHNVKNYYYYCFYSPFQMGFYWAANEMGVKSFEYQHGVQNNDHFAYGSWGNSAEGYVPYLPTNFLVFSRKEYELHEKNLCRSNERNVEIVGRLFPEFYSSRLQKEEKLKQLIKQKNERKVILYTIGKDVLSPKHFIWEIIASSDFSKFMWILRLHPGHKHLIDEINLRFKSDILERLQIKDWVEFELYDLLTISNLHITDYSTVAIEASDFGVSTIILSELGRKYYQQELETGQMYFAESEKHFYDLLTSEIRNDGK